jgi:hypothetical protein
VPADRETFDIGCSSNPRYVDEVLDQKRKLSNAIARAAIEYLRAELDRRATRRQD